MPLNVLSSSPESFVSKAAPNLPSATSAIHPSIPERISKIALLGSDFTTIVPNPSTPDQEEKRPSELFTRSSPAIFK